MLPQKIELTAAAPCASSPTPPVSNRRRFLGAAASASGLVLHAPRIRMMRGPAVAMPELGAGGCRRSGGCPPRPAARRCSRRPCLSHEQLSAGPWQVDDDLQPAQQALLDDLAGIRGLGRTAPGGSRNTIIREMLLCCGSRTWGAYGMSIVRGSLLRGTRIGRCWPGSEAAMAQGYCPFVAFCDAQHYHCYRSWRRADRRGRLAGAAAFSRQQCSYGGRAPVESLHVPGGPAAGADSSLGERLKARRRDP